MKIVYCAETESTRRWGKRGEPLGSMVHGVTMT